jgi:hypothetical protein
MFDLCYEQAVLELSNCSSEGHDMPFRAHNIIQQLFDSCQFEFL